MMHKCMPYEAKPPVENLANCGGGGDNNPSSGNYAHWFRLKKCHFVNFLNFMKGVFSKPSGKRKVAPIFCFFS